MSARVWALWCPVCELPGTHLCVRGEGLVLRREHDVRHHGGHPTMWVRRVPVPVRAVAA